MSFKICLLDRLSSLLSFGVICNPASPGNRSRNHLHRPNQQTTAGFLSYHSSVVNVPPIRPHESAFDHIEGHDSPGLPLSTFLFSRSATTITLFVLASYAPSRFRFPQGTSPNFTTAPLFCQIRQALFFIVFSARFSQQIPTTLPLHNNHGHTTYTAAKPNKLSLNHRAQSLTLPHYHPPRKSTNPPLLSIPTYTMRHHLTKRVARDTHKPLLLLLSSSLDNVPPPLISTGGLALYHALL